MTLTVTSDRFAYGVDNLGPTGKGLAKQAPEALVTTLQTYENETQPKIEQAQAELQSAMAALKAAKQKYKASPSADLKSAVVAAQKQVEASQTNLRQVEGDCGVGLIRLSGVTGRDLLFKSEAQPFDTADAGHAAVAPQNATLWGIEYSYHSDRPRDCYLTDLPQDGIVTWSMICGPSAHVGLPLDGTQPTPEQLKMAEEAFNDFRFSNVYEYLVLFQGNDGTTKTLTSGTFAVKDKRHGDLATLSPDLKIDMRRPGIYTFKGSAVGSAGPEGYTSARVTRVHVG